MRFLKKNNNKVEKTAQEHLALAEAHKQAIKNQWKIFLQTGVFVLAAMIALLALALAWFAMNDRVGAEMSGISAQHRTVELRTYGSAGIHDDVLKKIMGMNGENGFWYRLNSLSENFMETSSQTPALNWLLSDESKVGNYSTAQDWSVYWDQTDSRRTDYAIEPGSSGELVFYVVPYYEGDITVNCSFDLIGYKHDSSDYIQLQESDYAYGFLGGHILFFLETKNEDDTIDLTWIKDGTFELTINSAQSGHEYPYTIYWIWPQTFAEYVLQSGDGYLYDRSPLLNSFSNKEKLREMVVLNDSDRSMVNAPQKYFYSSLTRSPLTKEQNETEISHIVDIYNKSTIELSTDNPAAMQAFIDLSSYYNQADQVIGKNIDCVRIKLVANPN